jgi:hypothetical protein
MGSVRTKSYVCVPKRFLLLMLVLLVLLKGAKKKRIWRRKRGLRGTVRAVIVLAKHESGSCQII